jgi:ribosome-associated toxin RatA of RatAB toxin-antitoxin module
MALLKSRRRKIIAAAAIVAVILIVGAFAYIEVLVASLGNIANNPAIPSPRLSGFLNFQGLLSYNNGQYEYPYLTVIYNTSNAIQIYANASIYQNPIPTHLYILNFSNQCIGCGNATVAVNSLVSGIKGYGMAGLYANWSYVSVSNLNSIRNNSILVVLNGFIPEELEADNFSLMESLLNRSTSIVYVGLNFSSMVVSGIRPTQEPTSGLPRFLYTKPPTYSSYKSGAGGVFTFNAPTFVFKNSTQYGYVTYSNFSQAGFNSNGSVVAFPNNLASWPSEQQAGSDIAKAIWQMFWLPRYDYGSTVGAIGPKGVGSIGVVMNGTEIPYNINMPAVLNSGYLRVIVQAQPLYTGKQPAYVYIGGRPQMNARGIVSLQPTVFPNESNVKITFNVTSKPLIPVNLSTYVGFYTQNLSYLVTFLGPTPHAFSSASPALIVHQDIGLGPGKYIVMLRNFTDNTSIASGYFVVPKYNITLLQSNLTSGLFVLRITSGGVPINNIPFNISINNIYASTVSGVVKSGVLEYRLPPGTPIPNQINLTINMLGQRIQLSYTHYLLPFEINSQYIELGVVLLMIIIMVAFVRAPAKDEFYIDVPNLPEEKKVDIKIKAAEVLGVFDKLNANYHWRYMPLSKTEMKSAIAINLKYNNIPVELTYRNIDSILDSLLVNKYIVEADELYAPAAWTESSKHDIEYLAAFKKLRIYFVTHSYTFTDLDVSEEADVTAMLHGDKRYIVIYSPTTRFKSIPIYPQSKTYLVFLNEDAMTDFKVKLYGTASQAAEKLKMYISADYIRLVDADEIDRSIG